MVDRIAMEYVVVDESKEYLYTLECKEYVMNTTVKKPQKPVLISKTMKDKHSCSRWRLNLTCSILPLLELFTRTSDISLKIRYKSSQSLES